MTNSKYTEDWIPIKNINNGMIELENKYKVTGVKIRPRNIFILDGITQENTIALLKSFYDTIDFEFCIYLNTITAKNTGTMNRKHIVPSNILSNSIVVTYSFPIFVNTRSGDNKNNPIVYKSETHQNLFRLLHINALLNNLVNFTVFTSDFINKDFL